MKNINNQSIGISNEGIALVVTTIILLSIVVCLVCVLIVKFFKRNKNKKPTNGIDSKNIDYLIREKLNQLVEKNQILDKKLEEISSFSKQEAKNELIKRVDQEMATYINQKVRDAKSKIKQNTNEYAQQMIVEAMEDISEQVVISKTTHTINLKSDSVKGHIIGRNGKNITAFKEITGVDVIIDKEQTITLSSLNPKKREIAFLTMNKLLLKNIDSINIKKIYDEQVIIFNKKVEEYGSSAVEEELKIFDLNKELYYFIGNLFFRTSFGQNVLTHSIEVAKLCESIAKQLKLDSNKAKKIGLLHDIGKSVDYETDYDHVKQGIKIINKFIKDQDYINAIESHHNNTSCNNVYSWILKVADTISAARPGARSVTTEEYVHRVEEMEEICYSFEGVKEAHVYHSGRTLLVFVDPSVINDDQYEKLGFDIQKKLEENDLTNFYQIDITINRTNTFNIKTNPKIK